MSRLPEPGETWNDRYEIRSVLGRGGFGRVYRAWDPLLERDVAIKMLRLSEDFTPVDHQRFRRETNIAASLEHRNIVTVFDGGEHRGLLYLVMRFVAGRDLRNELEDGPLTPERAASIVRQVAEALDYAHGKGLVHRDVKPGNILCQSDSDTVFLADFGISRRVDQTTDNPVTQGLAPATLAYAAPEQMQTEVRVDGRADIYALGCVLFECLTGSKPFDGEMVAMIHAHLHEPPPRPSDRDPGLSRTWDRVIATAMAKDPADRFQRCRALANAVNFAIPPEPVPTAEPVEAPFTASSDAQISEPTGASSESAASAARSHDEDGATSRDAGQTARMTPPDHDAAEPREPTRRLERPADPTERAVPRGDDPASGAPPPPAGIDRPTRGGAAKRMPADASTSSALTDSHTVHGGDAARSADRPTDASRATAKHPTPPQPAHAADASRPSAKRPAAPPPAPQTAVDRSVGGAPSRERASEYEDAPQRGRRAALGALGVVVLALVVWFAWPLLRSGGAGSGVGEPAMRDGAAQASALDDSQLALLDDVGVFEPADCQTPTSGAFDGQQVAIACTSDAQTPTRVVFRQFTSAEARDAALAGMAGSAGDGDCSAGGRAAHDYTGSAGRGRVFCATDSSTAGLSWSVPDSAIMGSARLDDPARAGDLYTWWAELVGRSDR